MTTRVCITGEPGELETLDLCLSSALDRDVRWGEDDRRRLRLGLHELLVNILVHAYSNRRGPIEVAISTQPGEVEVEVTDRGRRFGGILRPELPGEPATGGYGLPIVFAVFDEVGYVRLGGENRWLLQARGRARGTR